MRGSSPRMTGRTSHPAGSLARARFGEMRVHDAPVAPLLAEYHGRAGNELLSAVMDVLGWGRLSGPLALGAPMAPDDRHVVRHHAANVEGRPVARSHVLTVEFPEPEPMVAALVSVTVE